MTRQDHFQIFSIYKISPCFTLMLRFVFKLVLAISFTSRTMAAGTSDLQKPMDQKQNKVQLISKILAQAQSIEREAWFVLSEQRVSPLGSFVKLQRAFEKENKFLKKNKVLACEKFDLRKDFIQTTKGFVVKGQLFESCESSSKHILDYSWDEEKMEMQLTLDPQFQPDVYGLGTAIFAKKILCHIAWNKSEIVTSLDCRGYKRNKTTEQIIELDQFEYHSEKNNLLTLKGKLTENLIIKKKIEAQVPLRGAIHVTETEVQQPQALPPQALPPQTSKLQAPQSQPKIQSQPQQLQQLPQQLQQQPQQLQQQQQQQQQQQPRELPEELRPVTTGTSQNLDGDQGFDSIETNPSSMNPTQVNPAEENPTNENLPNEGDRSKRNNR